MKKPVRTVSSFTLLFLLCATLVSATPKLKESNTEFGKYQIKAAQKTISIDGVQVPTYTVFYNNFEDPVHIGILNTKKCKNFIVRTTDGFEVLYVCNKSYFGVDKMDKDFSLHKTSSKYKLNRTEFLHQRVITTNQKTEEQLLELIACYLPMLIEKA